MRRSDRRCGLRQEACQIETRSNDLHSRTAGASREPVREAAIHGGAGETLLGTGTSTYRSSGKAHECKFDLHRSVHRNIISILKPTRCTNVSNLFYFGMTLYMFQTVFLSIIRSSGLYIQQQAFVKQILLSCLLASRQQQLCRDRGFCISVLIEWRAIHPMK